MIQTEGNNVKEDTRREKIKINVRPRQRKSASVNN
jgi:hypothetical protein